MYDKRLEKIPVNRIKTLLHRSEMLAKNGDIRGLKTVIGEFSILRHYVPDAKKSWAFAEYDRLCGQLKSLKETS